MENVQRFCGLQNNESFIFWDGMYSTFGRCFMWTTISYSCHAVLAIVCAYCFGLSRKFATRGKSIWVVLTALLPLALAATSVTELVLSYALKNEHPPAYVLSKTLSFSTWLFCFCVQYQIRGLNSQKREITTKIVVACLLVIGSTSMQLHYIIQHILKDKISLKNVPSEYIGIIVYFSLNVLFLLCCFGILFNKTSRTSFYRGLPSLTSSAPSIQSVNYDTSGETSDTASSISAVADENNYNIYTQHKRNNINIYLGKAESKNFLSQLFFLWCSPLISKGYHYQLNNPDDLFILPDNLDTNSIKEMFSSMLQIQKHNSVIHEAQTHFKDHEGKRGTHRISLMANLHKAFGKFYYSLGILKFLYDCCGFAGPILLNLLVSFMENKLDPIKHGYYYALGLFLSTLLAVIMGLQYQYYIKKVGLQVRAALITSIYEKALSVNICSFSSFSNGQIMNLMSTDSDRVVNFCNSFHEFWSMPFQVAVCLFLLYKQVGLAFLTGLGFIILLIPVNRYIANKIGELSKEMMKQKDERVQTMSELLFGVRIIKMFAWEQHFQSKVDEIRDKELKTLKGRKYLDALCVYFWATTPVLISVLTFVTYIIMGNQLTVAKVFTSIALFNMLIGPLNAFPWVLNGLMEAWVSLQRIEQYICLPEINKSDYYIKTSAYNEEQEMAFVIEKGNFHWQDSSKESSVKQYDDITDHGIATHFQLRNISLYVKKGQFIGISGHVAAGKSSLFSSITAELEKYNGYIYVPPDLEGFGYVTQESWIQHMSIKDNILFGSSYDTERYQEVLFACALNEDLNLLPAKDLTEVGENGVNLSGGQKARISLARAVYQDKDIYLLDDPIAAVDAHVANHIFKYCIMGLLRDKTRLLSTHHKKYLEGADYVIIMNDGIIEHSGLPDEVFSMDERMIHDKIEENEKSTSNLERESMENISLDSISLKDGKGKLIEDENKMKGVVSYAVFKAYWLATGSILSIAILLFLFLMQGSRNISDWWLAYWLSHSKRSDNTTVYYHQFDTSTSPNSSEVRKYLIIYVSIGVANSILTFFRAFLFAYGGIVAAKKLHKKLLKSILKAPLSYFDVTPIGRILNRFSSDTFSVDDDLPFIMNIFFAQAFGVLGTIIITCYGIPWFALVLVPLGAIYYVTQNYYRRTSRELKRLSTVTLSPIYEHFSETLTGLVTIRAFKESHRFINENERKLDLSQRANYSGNVASIWLNLRLNLIGVAMVTSVAFLAVFEHHFNTVNPGLVGLAISYALSITWKLSGLITSFTETEKQMVCVERVVEYITETPVEDEGSLLVQYHWPHIGEITFSKVGLEYRKGLPLALENVNLEILPGEKIGICGRTGSGKSSLFRLLFKTIPLTHGEIIIDGVDIKDVMVSQIRSQMSIIPQDPFLFNGTLADNLDPKKSCTSFELLDVLAKCHLTKLFNDLGGLDGNVGEKGQNLSCGQKQLLCLGRALLRKSKIICIDEATASVDHETDQLIQLTLRKEFSSSTVLTIAHRIETILDSDRVLVMSAGSVAEFATPSELLSDEGSLFSKLVKENSINHSTNQT